MKSVSHSQQLKWSMGALKRGDRLISRHRICFWEASSVCNDRHTYYEYNFLQGGSFLFSAIAGSSWCVNEPNDNRGRDEGYIVIDTTQGFCFRDVVYLNRGTVITCAHKVCKLNFEKMEFQINIPIKVRTMWRNFGWIKDI